MLESVPWIAIADAPVVIASLPCPSIVVVAAIAIEPMLAVVAIAPFADSSCQTPIVARLRVVEPQFAVQPIVVPPNVSAVASPTGYRHPFHTAYPLDYQIDSLAVVPC